VNERTANGRNLIFILLPLMSLAAIGCASSNAKPVDARAAGEWTFRLPETRSPYASLAVAHGTEAELAKVTAGDAKPDEPLIAAERKAKPQRAAHVRPAPAAREPESSQPAAPPAEAPQVSTDQPQELLALHTPAPASTSAGSDAERYAGREANAQKQREYRGGDAIVISASALVIILLVVILLLLLT
jgi:hypothetical protein